ncbi:MAG: tRNA pseudouridine(38-40) synthase TruA [Planctomycetia bacterium]|nr:tRNA pseudouridine(38-40) synthase TruA [Planctomycetia bacterium]
MPRIKLTLSYDGSNYSGWQVQLGQSSVQGTIEAVLARITGQPIRITASGRTDAGVHALGQVAAFDIDSRFTPAVLMRALNGELPYDIAVHSACEVPDSFDPIRHALRKRYRYLLNDAPVRDVFGRRYCWHCPPRLDVDAMRRACQALVGTHDFSSYETSGSPRATSIRTVFHLDLTRLPGPHSDRIELEIEADGFLYNMVRVIVGTLVEVGRGNRPESWPAEALAAQDRRAAGPTAPPEGLVLVRVEYPGQGSGGQVDVGSSR